MDGMSTLYIQEETFASFLMSLVGLCYLPLEEISAAMEELQVYEFDKEMDPESLKKIEAFRIKILKYTQDFWIDGHFPPSVWNYWMHGRNNTNNR